MPIGIGGDVMELVHSNQAVIEGFHSKLLHRKTEGGMGADQCLVSAL